MTQLAIEQPTPFAKMLKTSTRTDHDGVDKLVMDSKPFENANNYRSFLKLQYLFHTSVNPLYFNEELNVLLPNLKHLPRLEAVKSDMQDLEVELDTRNDDLAKIDNTYKAIGWLYCAEGSNIGAAFLYKETQKLNFDADFGAKHLAAHPDGRAPHWRQFVALLDALNITESQKSLAIDGAIDAFNFYRTTIAKLTPFGS